MTENSAVFSENEPRDPVAVRVLLPVHEMLGRRHIERIARNARAAMRRRPQPDELRAEPDRPAILVAGGMVEVDQDRHRIACPRRAAVARPVPTE